MKGKVLYNLPMTSKVAIEERAISLARYIIDSKDTVRGAAKKFCISKSTVHKDIQERLASIDTNKYKQVKEIMAEHLETRHLLGGESTRQLFLRKKQITL